MKDFCVILQIILVITSCSEVRPKQEIDFEQLENQRPVKWEFNCAPQDTLDNMVNFICSAKDHDLPEHKLEGEYFYDLEYDTLIPQTEKEYFFGKLRRIIQWNILLSQPYETVLNPYMNTRIVFDENGDTIKSLSKYSIVESETIDNTVQLNVKYVDPFIYHSNSSYRLQIINRSDSLIYQNTFSKNEFEVEFSTRAFTKDSILQVFLDHYRPNPNDSTRIYNEQHTFRIK